MKRKKVLVMVAAGFAFIAGAVTPAFAEHIPATPSGVFELSNHARVFLRADDWNPMVSLEWRFEGEELEIGTRSLTLGTYYRVHRNVKVGAFYRLQAGARHDDDWVKDDAMMWEWQDASDRYEHLLILDVTPRFLLEFLPGENWVLYLKNRYIYNTFNDHHVLQTRPSLTYFHLVDREPLLNVTAAFDTYFSLNFGETAVYRFYPYVNVLYHLSPLIKIDASFAPETVVWSTSQDAIDDGPYTVRYRPYVFGLGVIFYVDL